MALKGVKKTEEHKRNLSLSQKGRVNIGKHHSPDTEIKKGQRFSPKTEFKKGNIPYYKKHPEKIKRGKDSSQWKGGISFLPYSVDWTETLRRSIRERDNYICQICSQYGNYIHHIDYDKKNSNPDNLITLCKSCHSKTNHNRDYWINYLKGT